MITTGYVPYGHYVREFSPPMNNNGGRDSPLYSSGGTLSHQHQQAQSPPPLNVVDPRFSAKYGNPYLKQVR